MKIDIVERQPVRVAYLRHDAFAGAAPGQFWRRTVVPWLADHGLVDCPRYGVIADNEYGVGIELPRGMTLPDVPEASLAGGRYAVMYFKGSGDDVAAAWRAFTTQLLTEAGFHVDPTRPALEHMPRGAFHDTRTGVFACELCLPVGEPR